jgi:uncharacterized protein YkwD
MRTLVLALTLAVELIALPLQSQGHAASEAAVWPTQFSHGTPSGVLSWNTTVYGLRYNSSIVGRVACAQNIHWLDRRASQSEVCPDMELQLLVLLNQTRQEHELSPLVMDETLRRAARAHSQDMALRGYYGHDTPDGRTFNDRLAGVMILNGLVGENITIQTSAEEANRAFTASREHLSNMIEPKFHRVGIGVATTGSPSLMITEDFAE